jgi:Beta-propeller repeat
MAPAVPKASISVTVSPTAATVQAGATQQYTAEVSGTTYTLVTWSVNNVVGGDATVGTISASGLYRGPAAVPSPETVTVKATSLADSSKFASATVSITALADRRLWAKRFGGPNSDTGEAIAVDANENVLATGGFQGTVDFGGGPLTSAGSGDVYVAKFAGVDGAHLWSKRFGSTGADGGTGVAVDGSGDVLATGGFQGTVDFGGGALRGAGYSDIFVAKYSGVDGAHLWSKRLGSSGVDGGIGIAVDGSGNVLVMGFFDKTVNFGGGPLTSAGDYDIFVAKYSGGGRRPPVVEAIRGYRL